MICNRCGDNGLYFFQKFGEGTTIQGYSCILCGFWSDISSQAPKPKAAVKNKLVKPKATLKTCVNCGGNVDTAQSSDNICRNCKLAVQYYLMGRHKTLRVPMEFIPNELRAKCEAKMKGEA